MSQTTPEYTHVLERTAGLTETDYHRLLANERRRVVIDVLQSRTSPVGFEALVDEVVAREDGGADPDPVVRDRVAASLYHRHLPMMADLGVVAYDRDTGRIERFP